MKKNVKTIIFTTALILIGAISIFLLKPIYNNTKFGLDLKGGFEILYQVKPLDDGKITDDMVQATYKTIMRRIDALGVAEPEVSIEGNDRIRIKLAGVTNQEDALAMISTTAVLSFRDCNDNLLLTSTVLNNGGAKLSQDSSGKPAVALSIKEKDKFYDATNRVSKMENNVMVIWLDYDSMKNSYRKDRETCGSLKTSSCLSAATVSQGFASDVIIQGNFSLDEAQSLVELINSGSLPTKLVTLSSNKVDANFGITALNKTVIAGVIGIIAIMILMVSIYRFSGLIASVLITLYTLLVFLVNYLFGGVLTLPGIAALILGIGMAIDANVIIFERIKDQLYMGKNLQDAYEIGKTESFSSIFDANVTTFIVGVILFIFGESSVKGFATMLIISLFVTMFTMVFLTRLFLKLFVKTKFFDNKISLFIGARKKYLNNINKKYDRFDFYKNLKLYILLPIIIILCGIGFFIFRGANLSTDFMGGTSISVSSNEVLDSNKIEKEIEKLNYNIYSNEILDNGKTVYIKIKNELTDESGEKLASDLKEKFNVSTQLGVVNNQVKKDLVKNAIFSIIFAIIGIVIYVSIRYRFNYAISAIIALVHDTLIMAAFFMIFNYEISTIFIASILAIIGYSINDTIVYFDRIREKINTIKNSKKNKTNNDINYKDIVNQSLKETVFRSIITTLTTLLPIMSLLIFGSSNILSFNMSMVVGLVAGTYSSLFIACQLFAYLETKGKNKNKKSSWLDLSDEPKEKLIKGINS